MADRKVTFWSRGDIYACSCVEKQYRHVHCPCSECNGRATDRSTELRHWHQAKFLTDHETGLAIDARNSTDTESEVDSLDFSDAKNLPILIFTCNGLGVNMELYCAQQFIMYRRKASTECQNSDKTTF